MDKIERVEPAQASTVSPVEFRPSPRSGDDVVASFRKRSRGYGGKAEYAGAISGCARKERWCVLGANGAGNQICCSCVAGETEPDQGGGNVTSAAASGWAISHQHSMETAGPRSTVIRIRLDNGHFPAGGQGTLTQLAGCFASAFPATMSRSPVVCCLALD